MTRLAALSLAAALLGGCAAPARTPLPPPFPDGPIGAARAAEPDAAPVAAVPDSLAGRFAVYTADGRPATLAAVAEAMGAADVVFLGENHDDAVTHALQRLLLEQAYVRHGGARTLGIGLEMFERDVQIVIDEYLAGVSQEADFLTAVRPWSNYATDYRPLIEYARANGLDVVATNAPRRYVTLVAREGEAALGRFGRVPGGFIPRPPYPRPSAAYAEKFRAQMAAMAEAHPTGDAHGGAAPLSVQNLLLAQNLRDVAMAEAIALWLGEHRGGLLVHVNGRFHSEGGLGIPEHLPRYAPGARALVVTLRPAPDPAVAPGPSPGDGFLILTTGGAE